MRIRLAVVLGCLVAACRAFSSNDPGSGDVGTGGGDAGAGDSAALADSGGDGAPKNEAGATWCSAQGAHRACLDFDDGRTLAQLFDSFSGISADGGAPSITLNTTKTTSAPASLMFDVPPNRPDLQLFANLHFADATHGVSCAFDFAFDAAPSGYIGTLIWVELGQGFALALGETLELDSTNATVSSEPYSVPGVAWARVGLTIDTGKATASATLNGTLIASISLAGNGLSTVTPTVHFGTLYPTAGFVARYDNIVCDYVP
jgi:hypothetical protein